MRATFAVLSEASRVRLAYVAVALFYVIVAVHQPIGVNAVVRHDDTFFMTEAQSIVAGHWLGGFSHMTLIKGPGFTYFLVLNHYLRLPLTLTLALTLVASCAILVRVLGHVGLARPGVRLTLFALLLFQPAVMPVQVIRDSLYHSLFLLTVAGMISLTVDHRRTHLPVRAVLGGLALGMLWITREEGVWVLPALTLLVLSRAWQVRKDRSARVPFALAVAAFGVTALVPTVATSAVNQHEYGTFAVQDFKSSGFQATMQALDGISGGREIRQVPVSAENLKRAYEVSPTLSQLKPFFDSPDLEGWLDMSCAAVPDSCGSYLGGLLPWALRDAASFALAYETPQTADAFYHRIADEINAACDRGELTCRSSPVPLVPVITKGIVRRLPDSVWTALRVTLYNTGTAPTRPSIGTAAELSTLSDFLGNPRRVPSAEEGYNGSMAGWSQVKVQLEHVYSVISPIVFVAGLLAFVASAALWLRRRLVGGPMLLVATIAWVLYASRLALIAMIDASSFPAINAQYLEPAFLILYVASFTSITALLPILHARRAMTVSHDAMTDEQHLKVDL